MIEPQVLEKVKNIASELEVSHQDVLYGLWLLAERVFDYPELTLAQISEVVYMGNTDQIHILKTIVPFLQDKFTIEELNYSFTHAPAYVQTV